MSKPSYGDSGCIFALATPLAESALALVRLTGSAAEGNGNDGNNLSAIQLFAKIFSRPEKILNASPNSIVHGWIIEPESSASGAMAKKIDEVLVSVYKAPASYTGEDGADISCHGGLAVIKAVTEALKKAGFREALPGEFTFRAFMNGKLDLTRAESVMELVSAKTHKGREQALRRLSGVLEKEISAVKALLVEVLAGTEIYLDYSEDEFMSASGGEESGRLPDRNLAEEAACRLKTLAELWQRERIFAEGVLAVLAGRPNAGKSSLFNYIIREDRSIVTDVPGTTRDWIDAQISVEGIPLRLADTAGLKSSPSNETMPDEAEQIGIQRSIELLGKADLVLYVIDGSKGVASEDREFIIRHNEAASGKPLLVLWNKADLAQMPACNAAGNNADADSEKLNNFIAVSAKTGEGIQSLMRSIAGIFENSSGAAEISAQNSAGPGTQRQKDLIDAALSNVEDALLLADNGEPLELIAPLFRSAVNALGEITGEVSTAEILETMFSRFCVGK